MKAAEELHNKVDVSARIYHLQKFDYVRMVKLLQDLGFSIDILFLLGPDQPQFIIGFDWDKLVRKKIVSLPHDCIGTSS